MSETEEKPDKKSEEKESPPSIIYHIDGDFIQGDKTSVGDVTNSEGIAAGTGASAAVQKGPPSASSAGEYAGDQELDAHDIYKWMIDGFDLAEIQELCFELDVEYEDLSGSGRKGKARELVRYMERRGRLGELVVKIRELRGL